MFEAPHESCRSKMFAHYFNVALNPQEPPVVTWIWYPPAPATAMNAEMKDSLASDNTCPSLGTPVVAEEIDGSIISKGRILLYQCLYPCSFLNGVTAANPSTSFPIGLLHRAVGRRFASRFCTPSVVPFA